MLRRILEETSQYAEGTNQIYLPLNEDAAALLIQYLARGLPGKKKPIKRNTSKNRSQKEKGLTL